MTGTSNTFFRYFEQGRGLLAKAVELDEKLESNSSREVYVEAIETYRKVLNFFLQAERMSSALDIRSLTTEEKKKRLNQFLPSTKDRYGTLNEKLYALDTTTAMSSSLKTRREPQTSTSRVAPLARSRVTENVDPRPTRNEILRGTDKRFAEKLLDEVIDTTGVTLSDISGCAAAKSALEEAIVLPSLNPGLFSGLRQPVKGILLFGPPGNGKTMLAKAIANDTKQTFFNISASTLTSKWVGDGEKAVRTLFQMARNAQPCVIFIDEVDSILCSRSENENEASRRLKTEFLVQFDGTLSSANDRILLIAATNRPQELDEAVLRRLPKRIFIPLPDDAARYAAVKMILNKHQMSKGLCDSEYKYIASRTSGYSYADIYAVCQEASMVPVRALDKKTLARTHPAHIRPLKLSDFDHAVTVIRPSTNQRNIEILQEFASTSGQT